MYIENSNKILNELHWIHVCTYVRAINEFNASIPLHWLLPVWCCVVLCAYLSFTALIMSEMIEKWFACKLLYILYLIQKDD